MGRKHLINLDEYKYNKNKIRHTYALLTVNFATNFDALFVIYNPKVTASSFQAM